MRTMEDVPAAPIRLLLVEDDEFDRKSLNRLLRGARPEVALVEAHDLAAARRALGEEELDLVLLDHLLPDGEGLVFLSELPLLCEVPPPVIVLTGSVDEALAVRCLQAGAQDYLVKGRFDQDALLRSVRHSLERARLGRALLRQARELLRSNRELERFAAVASHDLREPLRTVRVLGQRLSERCGDALDPRGREYLERMIQASGRMEEMVRQLLLLSQVAQTPIQPRPVPLGPLLESVRADLSSTLEQSPALLEVGALPAVLGDETQLRRLFMNLIGNALNYRHPERDPCVKVQAAPALPGAERVSVTVEDNGVGFPPRQADEIFRPFRRLHPGTSGAGMGLAICRAIAENHEGEITAAGVPEQGATFTVVLPLPGRRHHPVETDGSPHSESSLSAS